MNHHTDPRKKRRGPEINNGGVQENVARIMAKIDAGEKVVPLRKGEVLSKKVKEKLRVKLYKIGVCTGCRRQLIVDTKGVVFHQPGVITRTETCPYAVIDYREEKDYENHSIKVLIGGSVSRSVSFFSWDPIPVDPALFRHMVPDWAFFSDDGEFL